LSVQFITLFVITLTAPKRRFIVSCVVNDSEVVEIRSMSKKSLSNNKTEEGNGKETRKAALATTKRICCALQMRVARISLERPNSSNSAPTG
jgi:hypothetical protein